MNTGLTNHQINFIISALTEVRETYEDEDEPGTYTLFNDKMSDVEIDELIQELESMVSIMPEEDYCDRVTNLQNLMGNEMSTPALPWEFCQEWLRRLPNIDPGNDTEEYQTWGYAWHGTMVEEEELTHYSLIFEWIDLHESTNMQDIELTQKALSYIISEQLEREGISEEEYKQLTGK